MSFYTPHYTRAKYLFRISQSFHRFQLFSQTHATIQQPLAKPTVKTPPKSFLSVIPVDAKQPITIKLLKSSHEGLGITIVGGDDSKRLSQGIFIKKIKADSVCAKDGRLNVGDQILSVNGRSLENISHENALNILKSCTYSINIVLLKHSNSTILDKSGLSPRMNYSQLIRDGDSAWQANVPLNKLDVHAQLDGIKPVEPFDEEDYSERCIDDYTSKHEATHRVTTQYSNGMKDINSEPITATSYRELGQDITTSREVESPRHHVDVIVNDVTVDRQYNPDESSVDSDTEPLFQTSGMMNLKRSAAFEGLNKIASSEDDDVSEKQSDNMEELASKQSDNMEELASNTLEESNGETFTVSLNKLNGSYGISIMGGTDSALPHGGIYIQALQKNGPACNTEQLQVGDHILSVNGVSLEHVSHKKAVDVLKCSPNTTKFVIARNDVIRSRPTSSLERDNVFEVEIEKHTDGLGLLLAGGADADVVFKGEFMIKKMFPGQPFYKCGHFQKGDIILAINDQVLEGLTHAQGLSIIRSLPSTVRIIAKRPNVADIPQELFVGSRPVSPEKILNELKTKDFQVDGRTSQEGNRIAKKLMKKTLPLITNSNESPESDGIFHHATSNEEFSLHATSNEDISQSDEDAVSEELVLPLTSTEVATARSLATGRNMSQLSDDTSTLGFPRHRPENVEACQEVFYLLKDDDGKHGLMFEKNRDGSLLIGSVEMNSPAYRQKVFKKGLQIESINDVTVRDMDHNVVERLIRKFSKRLKFRVSRPSPPSDMHYHPPTGDTYGESSFMVPELKDTPLKDTPLKDTPLKNAPLKDAPLKDAPLKDTPLKDAPLKDAPLKDKPSSDKHKQTHSSTSSQESTLSPPVMMRSVPSSPLLKRLNVMSRSNSKEKDESSARTSIASSNMGEVTLVQLEKGPRGLGITLGTHNTDKEKYVYIKGIVSGSVAEESGRLCVGDRIVSINGRNVEESSQKEIVATFRVLTGTVTIECFRAPTDVETLGGIKGSPLKLPQLPTIENTDNSTNVFTFEHIKDQPNNDKEMFDMKVLKNPRPYPNNTFDEFEMLDTSSPAPKRLANQQADINKPLANQQSAVDKPLANQQSAIDTPLSNQHASFDEDEKSQNDDDVVFHSSDGISFGDTLSILQSEDSNTDIDADNIDVDNMTDVQAAIQRLAVSEDEVSREESPRESPLRGRSPKQISRGESSIVQRPLSDSESEFGFSESVNFSLPGMDSEGIIRTSSASPLDHTSPLTQNELQNDSVFPQDERRQSLNEPSLPAENPMSSISYDVGRDRSSSSNLSYKLINRKDFKHYTRYNVEKILHQIHEKLSTTKAEEEFTQLRQMKVAVDTSDVGSRASNRTKNRNKTVLPYDSNRVQLQGGEERDYINASHIKIDLEGQRKKYIITQAPLESTVEDFWRCIWENKIEVIAMLVKCQEAGKDRCFVYWPTVVKQPMIILERFEVVLLYEEEQQMFTYRKIQIRNIKLDKSLVVTQTCFNEWPHAGVPKDMINLLGFIKFVHDYTTSSPLLIHCSNGVGRCGIFVVIDYIWHTIDNDANFDVVSIVKVLKQQRQQIFQTKEQYIFIYQAIRELFNDLLS